MAQDPIDVGSEKQLLFDNRFIESNQNLELTMNPSQHVVGAGARGRQPLGDAHRRL
jgi:hypothetical protein